MDFELSEAQKMFRQGVRDFVQREVVPIVDEAEANERTPVELFPKLGKLGYLCPAYPEEYSGGGLDKVADCILLEEFARVCAGITAGIMVQSGLATSILLTHGNEDLKQRFLVPACKGEKISAFGLTEPNAGSDAVAIETTARKDGDYYIINGSKQYITNAEVSDFVTVAAITDKSQGPRGVSAIVVESNTPGITIRKLKKLGFHSGATGEIFFDDCRVPVANLVGEEGRGFIYVMECLDAGRISHSATSIGLAQAAFEASLDYAQQRVQFDQPIYKFQVNSFKLARMAMELEAARALMYRAASMYDKGARRFNEPAMSKLFASEVAARITTEAMQIHGGTALMSDSPVQRYFRDARRGTITEGTSEIQEIVISRGIGLR